MSKKLLVLLSATFISCQDKPLTLQSRVFSSGDFARMTHSKIRDICDNEELCALHDVVLAERSPDGGHVIGGLGAGLILTDSTGRFVRRIGGKGKGPGEYQWIVAAKFKDRRLYVFDTGLNRLSWYSLSGEFIGSRNLPMPPATPVGIALNGSSPYILASTTNGDSADMVVHRNETRGYRSVTSFKAAPLEEVGGLGVKLPPFFQPNASFDVAEDDAVYSTNGASYFIRRYAESADDRWIVDVKPESVTPADIDRLLQYKLARPGSLPPQFREQIESAAKHASRTMPVVAEVKAVHGLVWVRRYAKPWEDSVRWDAWSINGKPVGYLVIPTSSTIASGDSNSIIIIGKNDMDVPVVTHFRIFY